MSENPQTADMAALAAATYAEYESREANSLTTFVERLVIPSASGPQRFKDCIEPFQREFFATVAPSLQAVLAGHVPAIRRFWIERTKKASKDSDLACCLLWLISHAKRPLLIQVVASDRDQANIVKRRASDLLFHNEGLNKSVRIQHHKILSRTLRPNGDPMAEVVIEASDVKGGAHGETPDLLILNEVTHAKTVWATMEAHRNNADGVPRGVVIVSTNAGIKGTKAELWRKEALRNPERWWTQVWNHRAPWLSDEDVEEARRRDPVGSEFARLWEGKWVSGSGGAVDESALERCFRLSGPTLGPEPGWTILMGLDMGETHDHSGAVVIGVNQSERRIKVFLVKGWVPDLPNPDGKLEVDGDAVTQWCLMTAKQYNAAYFGYDPASGARFIAQELRKKGIPMQEMSFGSPTNLTAMATSFVQTINGGVLECYDDPDGRLRRDFGKFTIEPRTPGGYKLTAVSDQHGHADVGTALVICLPKAMEMLGWMGSYVVGDEEVDDDTPLTKEEVKEMPDVLRGIYEMYDDEEKYRRSPIDGFEYDDDDDDDMPRHSS